MSVQSTVEGFMVAAKVTISLPRLTKAQKADLANWAKNNSGGVLDTPAYMAIGIVGAISSLSEQLGGDAELARALSAIVLRRYPELKGQNKTDPISKAVIGDHRNRKTTGRINDRALIAIGELMGIAEPDTWWWMAELGKKMIGEGHVDHVPLGVGAALSALSRADELLQEAKSGVTNAIATLLDKTMQYSDLGAFFAAYNARYQDRLDTFIEFCNEGEEGPIPEDDPEYFSLARWQEILQNPQSLTDDEIKWIQQGITEQENTFFEEGDRRKVSYEFLRRLRDGISEPSQSQQKTSHPEENGAPMGGGMF